MATRTATKAHDKGITDEIAREIVFKRGCFELSSQIGCSLESAKNYAMDELQIPNPPLWVANDARSIDELKHLVVLEMFEVNQKAMEFIREYRAEEKKRSDTEHNREQLQKSELINMLNKAREWKTELESA